MIAVRRSILALAVAALVAVMAGCAEETRVPAFGRDIDELLREGGAYASALATLPPEELEEEEVIALGYFERASRGMGSPFRLIDIASEDVRLSREVRTGVAYGILEMTLRQEGYRVPLAVLDLVRLTGVGLWASTGDHHLQIIERTVSRAPTADAGERAVRIAYEMAEAERVVSGMTHSVIPHVTALVADRRRAREDAVEMLRAAAAGSRDPILVLREWRQERRFRVEGPALGRLADEEEAFEAREGPEVTRTLRQLALRLASPLPQALPAPAPSGSAGTSSTFLAPGVAARLASLAAVADAPPRAPVAVALEIHRPALLTLGADTLRHAREAFLEAAYNEERFVAHATMLAHRDPGVVTRLQLAGVQAAVFLRALNQEEPWARVAATAPSARDLEARFGLEAIRFDGVPEHWQPYYRRVLQQALADLQRVVPTISYRGLTLRFGELHGHPFALAIHDPRTRTLHLPPRTGAGTLAHELAHDLDWQLARRRYGRVGYATDLAVNRPGTDRIAASVNGLAGSLIRRPGDPTGPIDEDRPAEVFARGFDWLVAASLAADGRTGGYLTSFQDPALTGYGTTRAADVAGGAAPSLFSILDQIAPVDPELRRWIMAAYGPSRVIAPEEIARTVARAGRGQPAEERIAAIRLARDRALRTLDAEPCRAAEARQAGQWRMDRRRLVEQVARSAVHGAVVDGAYQLMRTAEVEIRPSSVLAWVQWRLHGAPEPADPQLAVLEPGLEMLVHRAALVLDAADEVHRVGFPAGRDVVLCGENPFAVRRGF
jgi:hypothetical protein